MSSEARRVTGGHQKKLVKMFESLCGRYSRWDIWSDFIFFSAAAISNAVDKSFAEEREKEYLSRSSKYKPAEMQTFAKMFAEVVNGMEHEPDQDFLGELYMALGLGNDKNGQFFTPYGVCVAMSQLTGDFKQKVESEGWISVNDPACGAGATLIAFANECRRAGINYQTDVLFVGQDIDFITGLMCYLQLSLLGCAGYIVIGNTLTNPMTCYDEKGLIPKKGSNVWYTPMYFRDIWQWRVAAAQMEIMCRGMKLPAEEENKQQKPSEPVATVHKNEDTEQITEDAQEVLKETKTGQLMFF